jgi:thiamine transporter 2/3
MHWILVTVLVCCYGFFKDLRPSDGYLTEFLTSEFKNLTLDEVNNEIYPCKTYSYTVSLVPILMFADYFKYRSLLIVDVVLFIITWILVLWTGGIIAMKSMQVVYGLASAGEIGYFYYLYALVDKENYRKCSSFIRFSSSGGRF